MRKIIQINSHWSKESDIPRLVALCNDGTVWGRMNGITEEWFQMASVPQNEPVIRISEKEFKCNTCDREFKHETSIEDLKYLTCICGAKFEDIKIEKLG